MPRSRESTQGILEVGFFFELKNRHIIQRFPVAPKPHIPSPTKPKGKEGEAEDGTFLQRPPVGARGRWDEGAGQAQAGLR